MSESRSSGAERPHELAANAHNYQLTHADTVHERVFDIAQLLQRWWRFPELVKHWVSHNDGARSKRGRSSEESILRQLLTDDSNPMVKAMKDDSLCINMA
jgi:hypothetical protein